MSTIAAALAGFSLIITMSLAQERTGASNPVSSNRGMDIPSLGLPIRISGTVTQIDLERNAIQVRSKDRKQPVGFALDPKCKIKADKKQFDKGELKLAEVQIGYEVELTVRRADLQIIEMKVKKPKNSESS